MTVASASDIAAAKAYFDRFVEAFATFDGAQVASLFAPPVVAVRADGSTVGLATADDVVRYYQAALDKYRSEAVSRALVRPHGDADGRASMLGLRDPGSCEAGRLDHHAMAPILRLARLDGGEPKAFPPAPRTGEV